MDLLRIIATPADLWLRTKELKYAQSHYYKVVYFIDLSTLGTTIPLTPASLLYTIKCTQVD